MSDFRSVRESVADVRRQARGEEEDSDLQVQPQPNLQRDIRVRRPVGTNPGLRSRCSGDSN